MGRGRPTTPRIGDRVPDLVEPVLGYRFWKVTRGGALRCVLSRERWSAGVNTASCWRGAHEAPGRICNCGFNALHEMPGEDFDEYRRVVLGAIAAWGQIDVHKLGFRAQHARVIALTEDGVRAQPPRRRLQRAAERYGVPLVPAALLPGTAEQYAKPVDPVVLPGRRAQRQRV